MAARPCLVTNSGSHAAAEPRDSLSVVLGAFALPFAGVLRIFAGLRKIRIRIFQHWISITMSQLSLQSGVSGSLVIFGFHRALPHILVHFFMCHECDLCEDLRVWNRLL